ncbi:MAG: hypothetical protein QOJ04_5277 [Caballeronia sp.]|jgi:hypothetical protein|nr:hypothetical protein [Caballeronia sp.]MEA3113185.1 hypothetical protein [Caballeronia sp.]
MKVLKQGFAVFVSSCLVLGITHHAFAGQADQSVLAPAQATQWTPDQLQQLVAPIALYPDALVAQILAASTHPVELVEADRWMQEHSALKGDALAVEVDKQSWDPSVQALTQFPSVLANADQNLAWISSLGDAYLNQPQDLMAAVQVMRQRAEQAGYLQSTGQESVATQGQTITIEPAAPDVVYLPEYDPWLTYGTPVAVWPGWYPYSGLYLDGPGIAFGAGFGLGYFGGYRWGWHHWRPDWERRTIIYNHSTYISRSAMVTNRNDFLHEHENFNRTQTFHGDRGFPGIPGSHGVAAPQRGFAESNVGLGRNSGRFNGFGNERVGDGRAGFDGFAHEGAGGHGEVSHGGGGRR